MTSFNLTLGLRFDLYKPRDANEAFPCPFWHYRTHGTFFNTFIHWKNMYLSWIVHSFGLILVWDFTYIEHEMQLRSSHTSFGTIEPWVHTLKKICISCIKMPSSSKMYTLYLSLIVHFFALFSTWDFTYIGHKMHLKHSHTF